MKKEYVSSVQDMFGSQSVEIFRLDLMMFRYFIDSGENSKTMTTKELSDPTNAYISLGLLKRLIGAKNTNKIIIKINEMHTNTLKKVNTK